MWVRERAARRCLLLTSPPHQHPSGSVSSILSAIILIYIFRCTGIRLYIVLDFRLVGIRRRDTMSSFVILSGQIFQQPESERKVTTWDPSTIVTIVVLFMTWRNLKKTFVHSLLTYKLKAIYKNLVCLPSRLVGSLLAEWKNSVFLLILTFRPLEIKTTNKEQIKINVLISLLSPGTE